MGTPLGAQTLSIVLHDKIKNWIVINIPWREKSRKPKSEFRVGTITF